MSLAVKQDEAPHPMHVRRLGARTRVADAESKADLVEQTRRAGRGRRRRTAAVLVAGPTDRSRNPPRIVRFHRVRSSRGTTPAPRVAERRAQGARERPRRPRGWSRSRRLRRLAEARSTRPAPLPRLPGPSVIPSARREIGTKIRMAIRMSIKMPIGLEIRIEITAGRLLRHRSTRFRGDTGVRATYPPPRSQRKVSNRSHAPATLSTPDRSLHSINRSLSLASTALRLHILCEGDQGGSSSSRMLGSGRSACASRCRALGQHSPRWPYPSPERSGS